VALEPGAAGPLLTGPGGEDEHAARRKALTPIEKLEQLVEADEEAAATMIKQLLRS
jgi:flagellar biosynthesis/type III secretory pathway M-ring protein FliF/YscJ